MGVRPEGHAEGVRRVRLLPRARGPARPEGPRGEPRGERPPQRLGVRRHLLRSPLRADRDLPRGGPRDRGPGRVVRPPGDGQRELRDRAARSPPQRTPRLPDRAPPVPEPPGVALPGDGAPRPRHLRAARRPVHHRLARGAVRERDAPALPPRAPAPEGRGRELALPADRPTLVVARAAEDAEVRARRGAPGELRLARPAGGASRSGARRTGKVRASPSSGAARSPRR